MRPANKIAVVLLFVLVLRAGASASAQFESRIATPALVYPKTMVSGDFNNDGRVDIAVASVYDENGITLLLSNGDGTFRASEFTVNGGTYSVTAADFNHDGNLDLAVIQYLNLTVSVLFGNGDGTFQAPVDYLLPEGPFFLASGDFNGDGFPDLIAISSYGCKCMSVMLNNGDGTFAAPLDTTTTTPFNLGLGDFNRDGKLDAMVGGANGLQIFLGNGDGTFTAGADYPEVGTFGSMLLPAADLRGIGILDLVVPGDDDNSVAVLLGNGDGTFGPATDYRATWAVSAAIADFNGDGKLDIVASDENPSGTSGATVLLGRGDGTFGKGTFYPAGGEAVAVIAADFNGDKKMDVAVADHLNSNVITLLNTGTVSFTPTAPLTFPPVLLGATTAPLSTKLTNQGKSPLTISSIKNSGSPFKVKTTCQNSIAPGASCTIAATFTAQSEGVTTGTVSIQDSADSKPQVVELVGTGSVVKLTPWSLAFAAQKVDTRSAPQTMQLTNIGSAALEFSRTLYIGGKNYDDFSESDNCLPQIAAGASCTITVTFKPRATGARAANVSITDDGGGSPQTPALTGSGVD